MDFTQSESPLQPSQAPMGFASPAPSPVNPPAPAPVKLQEYKRPSPPAKAGLFLRMGRTIKEIFGQFFTLDFYKEAAKTIVHEMMVAFMYGFGKGVVHIASKKANPETAGIKLTTSQTSASSAFSNSGFGSSTGMRSGFSSAPRDGAPFPGF